MAKPAVRTQRYSGSQTVAIHSTLIASATSIDFRNAAGGCLYVASTVASTTFTFYGCSTIDGTFFPLYAYTGVAVTATVPGATNCVVEIPPACFGVPFLRLLCSGADDLETVIACIKS